MFSGDRELSRCVLFGAPACNFGGSSGMPQGRFIFLDPRGDVDGDGEADVIDIVLDTGATGANYDPNNPASGDWHAFGTADRFNFRPFNYLITPNRRVNVFGKAAYDISDSVELTFTASFTNRESHGQAAPNPLFMGCDAGAGSFFLDNMFIPADHPFNPFGIDLGPDPADGGNNLVTRSRAGRSRPARASSTRTSILGCCRRALSGDLQLGERTHYWDVSVNLGRNNASQTGHNIFNARKLALALGPPDACAADSGLRAVQHLRRHWAPSRRRCSPGRRSRRTTGASRSSTTSRSTCPASCSICPSGAFAYALGFEYRKEIGSFTPDSIAQSGETADVPASPTAGEVKVNEAYPRAARAAAGGPAGRAAPGAVGRRALVGLRHASVAMRYSRAACTGACSTTCRCVRTTPKASARRTSASSSTPARVSTARWTIPATKYPGR